MTYFWWSQSLIAVQRILHVLKGWMGQNFLVIVIAIQWNSVITNHSGPAIFVRYNRVNLCSKMTNLPKKSVRYNRVFVNNRVCYNRIFFKNIEVLVDCRYMRFFHLWVEYLYKSLIFLEHILRFTVILGLLICGSFLIPIYRI